MFVGRGALEIRCHVIQEDDIQPYKFECFRRTHCLGLHIIKNYFIDSENGGSTVLLDIGQCLTVWCHIPGGCSLTMHWYEHWATHKGLCICYRMWREEVQQMKIRKKKPSLFRVLIRCFGCTALWLGLSMAISEFIFQ